MSSKVTVEYTDGTRDSFDYVDSWVADDNVLKLKKRPTMYHSPQVFMCIPLVNIKKWSC